MTDRLPIVALSGVNSTPNWRGYNASALNILTGTGDTSQHVFMLRVVTNSLSLSIDGTQIAQDTSGTAVIPTGFTLGGNTANTAQLMNGKIAYAVQTTTGYISPTSGTAVAWLNSIAAHYGLTQGW